MNIFQTGRQAEAYLKSSSAGDLELCDFRAVSELKHIRLPVKCKEK